MLHDGVLDRATIGSRGERRRSRRLPSRQEIVLLWHHDPAAPMRYPLVDASDGGFRIRSSMPLLEGMSGMTLRLLPSGLPLDRPVMVLWCRRDLSSDGYDIGLRLL